MPRKSEPDTFQAEPTAPRPVDDAGRTLDEHGLPIGGHARARALAGRADPRDAVAAPATTTGDDAGQQD